MAEIKDEENLFDESILSKKERDLLDESNVDESIVDEITDEDISDEKILEGMEDNTILLDAVRQYLLSIGKYRILSRTEQLELVKSYRNGNIEARETLIVHNLRLVVVVAKKLFKHARRLEFLDLIQEGNIGLMKAVELYNSNLNYSFSTYAYHAIYSHIQRAINEKDNIMHTPEWFNIMYNNYKKFVKGYINKFGKEPSKEIIKKKYNISEKTYQALVNFESHVLHPRSLDEKIDDGDKETDSLENFIFDMEKGYDILNDELDKRIYMYRLREALTTSEYYIAYHRLLSDKTKTLEQIGEELGITREGIRQIEGKVINKARTILKSRRIKKNDVSVGQIMRENFIPPDVLDVIVLAELKEKLDAEDYYIFYHTWYKKINVDIIAKKMSLSVDEIKRNIEDIITKYSELFENCQYVRDKFLELAKKTSGTKLYNQIETLEPSFNPVGETAKIVRNMSYGQVRRMADNLYNNVFTDKDRKLFDQYFDCSIKTIHPSKLEKTRAKINAIISHYQDSPYIDKRKLYQTMIDNQDKYVPNAIEYLKKTYFKEESGYNGPSPASENVNVSFYLNLFERLYYNLDEFGTYIVPKEIVEKIVYGTRYRFTDEERKIMSLKYGLNGEREHTLVEMAEMYGMDYVAMHDKYHSINYKMIDIYVGRHVMNNYSNPERYAKYINDERYIMTSEMRKASRLYFLEGKTYKEIVDIMKIKDTIRVSNILTDAARKMDFWEYGMIDFPIFEPNLVDRVLTNYNFTDLEKKVIRFRTDKGMMPDDIRQILGDEIKELDISNLMQNFTYKYYYLNGKERITMEDIIYQVTCPICDSVLDESERKVAAFIYGIKCEYNSLGEKRSQKTIAEDMQSSLVEIDNKFNHINHVLCGYKLGMVNAPFTEFSKEDIQHLLKDPRLPISDYEKELLAAIKGIDGKYWTPLELQKKYKMSGRGSISRRIKRAILTIKKYQAGEIEKKLIYEVDIAPILKYFGEYNRKIIIMRYRDNMLVKDMAKILGVSKSALDSYIQKIERKVLYLLKNSQAKKFDFDYARKVIHNPDLPFYGNFDLAYKYYLRMSGEDGLRPGGVSTIDDEDLIGQKSKASTLYILLMTSVLKYRDGIRKVKKIDADDLEEFYLSNKDNYSVSNQKLFESVIRNLRKVYPVFGKKYYSSYVISEYMKGREMSTFSFEDMTRDGAEKFIRENPYNLPRVDLERVRNYFGITSRELMSGKNQLRVLKMIEPAAFEYYQKRKKRLESIIQRGKLDAIKCGKIKENIGSPNINAYDLVKYLKEFDSDEKEVLITSPILDLVYAHISARYDSIDVLAMEDIYAYVFELQKIIMQDGPMILYNFFKSSLYPGRVHRIKNKNLKVWAFFDSLLQNKENADVFKLKYGKRDSASISPQYQADNYKAFKNRVMQARVKFIDNIPNKFYDVINIGDEIIDSDVNMAKEIIKEYKDNLSMDGRLIAYLKNDEDIPEIFDLEQYEVVNVRSPKVGVSSGGFKNDDEKVVIMQKQRKI